MTITHLNTVDSVGPQCERRRGRVGQEVPPGSAALGLPRDEEPGGAWRQARGCRGVPGDKGSDCVLSSDQGVEAG